MMELAFRVLGPLEVLVDGRLIPIASTRQRIVLAMLLMAPNHVVTVDMLIDAVWDGKPPLSARGQIQICISQLRRVIEAPETIETSPDGYRIRVSGDQLDYNVFNGALNRGRAAAAQGNLELAIQGLDAAINLWRGPALGGLPGRAAETHANRIEERRLMAIEDRLEMRLGLGAHRELIEELVALTNEYPLRERLWGFQMIALHRSGRQAEALSTYQTARRTLVEELGLEPGEQLRLLERAILTQDSSLDYPDRSQPQPSAVGRPPRQLPADIPDFVGREDLVKTLHAALTTSPDRDLEQKPIPVALITGPAGHGKSTVALHTAHLIRHRYPDGQLYADLHGSTLKPAPTIEVLASFLRALGVALHETPVDRAERINLLRSHLATRRLLIVLDDVADEHQISDLLPGVPGSAVLMTSRSRLAALPGVYVTELGIMSDEESMELLERIAGPERIAGDEATAELTRLCCGLPLALRISGMRLVAHPHWSVSTLVARLSDERRRLDELRHGDLGVRPLLSLVHSSLSPRARELFRLLSVLEMHDFSALIAAALLDSDLEEGERILDELTEARLLEATPMAGAGQLARYSFHELTRIFARECMTDDTPEYVTLAIERVFGCELAVADEAHRRVYGGDYTVLHGTSPRWPKAQSHFDRLLTDPLAWFDAERRNLRAAVIQAADFGMDEFCWELAVISVALYEYRGLFDEWRSTHKIALQAVDRTGNKRGQAAVLASLGSLGVGQHAEDDEKMLSESLAMFEEIGDELGQGLALRTLGHLDRIQGRPTSAAERYEQALERFRAVGDKGAQTHVLSGLARAYLDMGKLERAEAFAKESLLFGQQLENRRLQAQALYRLGEVLFRGSHMLAAKAVFKESLHITRQLGDRVGDGYALYGLGSAALEAGDPQSAEIYFTQSLDICQSVRERNIQAHSLLGLGRIYAERGEHVRAENYYAQAANLFAAQENAPWYSRALDALYAMRQATGRMLIPGRD